MVAWLWIACAEDQPAASASEPFTPPGAGVVTLEADDGVRLEADYYPQEAAGAPGIVLLHMVPPSNDRSNWPIAFREALYDAGFTVLALDRRGAGGSEGEPADAYEGPKGKLDVAAAVDRLVADGYGDVLLLGGSNGTTSMIDYAAWAPGEGRPAPVALGFMTGGSYTENQNAVADLPAVPAVFTYSTAERAWSEAQRPLDPGTWAFFEYAEGDHGTRMFDAAPEVATDLLAFYGPFATP